MFKANKLFAMAAKLEEEGIITPNTEVEVSASVSVTPEEQEKIDEALTEVEEIATASNEIEESVNEGEELSEAEATLTAIRDTIKREGIVTPQLYSFLQDAGYLDVISVFQNKLKYPATEAISNVSINKQYADSIVAGCEAGLASIASNVWKWIVNMCKKIKEFFQRIYTTIMASEKRITELKNKLASAATTVNTDNIPYGENNYTADNMQKVGNAIRSLSSLFIAELDNYGKIFGSKNKINAMNFKAGDDLKPIQDLADMKIGGAKTLSDAGLGVDELIGDAYDNTLECVKGCKGLKRALSSLDKLTSKIESMHKDMDKVPNSDPEELNNIREMKESIQKYSQGANVLFNSCWRVVRSYTVACNSILRASNK
jgi:hypothetical protein